MASPGLKAEELHNAHDIDGLIAIAAPDCTFVAGGKTMSWDEYIDACKAVFASFPDIKFAWSDTVTLDDGTVSSKVVVSGTHTGAPFGFGPFPKIDATVPGIKCQNDPEMVEWIVEGDKLKTMKVTGMQGSFKTGPLGFYVGIGGKVE